MRNEQILSGAAHTRTVGRVTILVAVTGEAEGGGWLGGSGHRAGT